jgi:hypothetical protein
MIERIDDLVSPEALNQLKNLESQLAQTGTKFEELLPKIQKISTEILKAGASWSSVSAAI